MGPEVHQQQMRRDKLDQSNAVRDARQIEVKARLNEQVTNMAQRKMKRKSAAPEIPRLGPHNDDEEELEVQPVKKQAPLALAAAEAQRRAEKQAALNTCVIVPASEWKSNKHFVDVVVDLNKWSEEIPFVDAHVGYHSANDKKSIYAGHRKFERRLQEPTIDPAWPVEAKQAVLRSHRMMEKMYTKTIASLKLQYTSAWEFVHGKDPDAPANAGMTRSQRELEYDLHRGMAASAVPLGRRASSSMLAARKRA